MASDEKEYEVEVTLTVRVTASGMYAAKRVAKAIVPASGAGATFEGSGEIQPKVKVTGARQVR